MKTMTLNFAALFYAIATYDAFLNGRLSDRAFQAAVKDIKLMHSVVLMGANEGIQHEITI